MRILFVAVSLYASAALAQRGDLSRVQVRIVPVSGQVSTLEGAGGNIGISAGPDGILIIDDQFAPLAPKIDEALRSLKAGPSTLRFVLNTHWHGDHTGGNEYFGRKAPIIAHQNVRLRLAGGLDTKARQVPPAPAGALPVITYGDGISIHLNGEEIRVVHLGPAHTDGDSVVFFTKSNVVHVGDQMIPGKFPFVDVDSGGSAKGLLSNMEKLRKMLQPGMKVLPGHGPVATAEDVDAYIAMLRETMKRVQTGIQAGKSLGQLQEENVLEGFESWNHDFIPTAKWIETLYRELGGWS